MIPNIFRLRTTFNQSSGQTSLSFHPPNPIILHFLALFTIAPLTCSNSRKIWSATSRSESLTMINSVSSTNPSTVSLAPSKSIVEGPSFRGDSSGKPVRLISSFRSRGSATSIKGPLALQKIAHQLHQLDYPIKVWFGPLYASKGSSQ